MPRWLWRIYLEKLPALKAAEQLDAIEVTAFPHLKKEDKQRLVRSLSRAAGREAKATVPASHEENVSTLGGMGIAVEVVDKDGRPVEPEQH
jgi:hypothetical protein